MTLNLIHSFYAFFRWSLGVLLIVCFAASPSLASDETRAVVADSLSIQHTVYPKKKETIDTVSIMKKSDVSIPVYRSVVVPGWGQVTNKKIWKVPIVYGGFGGLGYAIWFNKKYYNEFLTEYIARTDNNPNTIPNPDYERASTSQIVNIKDSYKRNLTLSIIGVVVLYAVQIIDAYVDAELANFDVSDNLTLRVRPSVQQGLLDGPRPMVRPGLNFTFSTK